MITALELENFKGVAARQRVEFAPLTLLFGANSAGKSSVLQALVYLHELLERGEADVDRTHLGGDVLELGGSLRDSEPLFVRVNLGHPTIADQARDIANAWEHVALSEVIKQLLVDRDEAEPGDPFAMSPSLDGEGFGVGRSLPVFVVSRSRLSALPPLSEPLRVLMPEGDDPTAREAETLEE